jgi:hypothetical protein
MTAIDIGVAQGEHTLFFLKKTLARRVYAFEPDTSTSESFSRNLRLNKLGDSTRLEFSTNFLGAHCDEHHITLDSIEACFDLPCLIKMDVDGYEEEILKGASSLNTRNDVRWLIETHSKDLESACIRILSSNGFCTRVIPNAWWRVILPEGRMIEHNRWLAAWKENP